MNSVSFNLFSSGSSGLVSSSSPGVVFSDQVTEYIHKVNSLFLEKQEASQKKQQDPSYLPTGVKDFRLFGFSPFPIWPSVHYSTTNVSIGQAQEDKEPSNFLPALIALSFGFLTAGLSVYWENSQEKLDLHNEFAEKTRQSFADLYERESFKDLPEEERAQFISVYEHLRRFNEATGTLLEKKVERAAFNMFLAGAIAAGAILMIAGNVFTIPFLFYTGLGVGSISAFMSACRLGYHFFRGNPYREEEREVKEALENVRHFTPQFDPTEQREVDLYA